MAINKKINIPMSTTGSLPNPNNKTAEAQYLTQLVNKTNRSNTGQNIFTSITSGIVYKTIDYPLEESVFNRGETGLYNLLVRLYGNDNGFIFMAEDYNDMADEINNVETKITKVTTDVTWLETRVDNLNTKIIAITTRVGTLENQMTALTTRVSAAETKINTINSGGLDGRYYLKSLTYTKTETNSLLSSKMDNSNITYGTAAPTSSTGGTIYVQYS